MLIRPDNRMTFWTSFQTSFQMKQPWRGLRQRQLGAIRQPGEQLGAIRQPGEQLGAISLAGRAVRGGQAEQLGSIRQAGKQLEASGRQAKWLGVIRQAGEQLRASALGLQEGSGRAEGPPPPLPLHEFRALGL
uniref:Uncharacterized protein n=1 Tax=Myotis myotis TaxID=51298 RepID=A0A7J7UPH9_MYOMY|nr:hypothetical protein mMyoMyo1_008587 [Myotis myotis]